MALVFDFDSTLIRDESLVQLLKDSLTAQQQLVLNTHTTTTDGSSSLLSPVNIYNSEPSVQNHLVHEIEQITNLGITNQISMLESYNRRLAIAKPTIQNMRDYVQRCEEIATPGMKNLINQIRRLFPQVPIRVVSQGPRCIVEPIVQQLFQIPGHHVHCVELDTERMQVSESDEMLIHGKSKMVQRSLATAESPFPVIMVGDGVSDMKVKLEGVAHYAIGYGEWLQFEQTKQLADYYVVNTHELELVLLKLLSEVHFGLKERSKTNNLFAGPAVLPTEVVHKMNQDLLSYGQSGISVMEFSHRTREFEDILNNTEQLVRELLNVPSDYEVLFVQGGATMQFSSIPMNLAHSNASYIVTGEWSKKAIAEAKKLSSIHRSAIHSAADCSSTQFTTLPEQFSFNQVSDYTYYCDNETVHGVEFPGIPEIVNVSERGNLVCDMSSNLFTRSVDVKKYGLIYSCAQKNFGIAGLTIVIVRGDLLGKASHAIPSYLDYKYLKDGGSMTNTPPTFAIYATQLVLKWIKENGGVEEMNRRCLDRSQKLYDVIEKSSIYTCPVMPHCRSRINVVFRVKADKDLEKQFVDEAASLGLVGLAGHRSVGGIRASIYNATSVNTVDKLIKFMKDFEQKHSS